MPSKELGNSVVSHPAAAAYKRRLYPHSTRQLQYIYTVRDSYIVPYYTHTLDTFFPHFIFPGSAFFLIHFLINSWALCGTRYYLSLFLVAFWLLFPFSLLLFFVFFFLASQRRAQDFMTSTAIATITAVNGRVIYAVYCILVCTVCTIVDHFRRKSWPLLS
jgi:hypothetical protein